MITANTAEVSASVEKYRVETVRKLQHMVSMFAGEIAQSASKETRLGDAVKYAGWYKQRAMLHGIQPVEGYHKGAWAYSEGNLIFDPTIRPYTSIGSDVSLKAQAQYKVGDSFTIGAIGTAYEMLQARDDIMGNAETAITTAYKTDLKRYFDEG